MRTESAIPVEAGDSKSGCPGESREPLTAGSVEADPALALADRQLAALERMREEGMAMVAALGRLATGKASQADKDGFGQTDLCLAFSRASRAVRQIIAMEQEIAGLRETRRKSIIGRRKFVMRQEMKRTVLEKAAAADSVVPSKLIALELDGICKDYDDYDDYDRGTQAEIIARLCKALRIPDPDLSIWQDHPFADDAPSDDDAPDHGMLAELISAGAQSGGDPSCVGPPDDAPDRGGGATGAIFGPWRDIPDAASPYWRHPARASGQDPP